MIDNNAINRFNPNKIDNKDFWKLVKNKFKLTSLCGANNHNIRTLKQANEATLDFSKKINLFTTLENYIQNNDNPKVLEIGYGQGNVFEQINDRCKYIGIDYTKPKEFNKYDNLLTIDKSGIPKDFDKDFDIIYCVNVMQHCSQIDRFEYIRQAYEHLKEGGKLIFSCLLVNNSNKDLPNMWSYRDKDDRRYCGFFNQLTEVDYEHEMLELLAVLGFSIEQFIVYRNTNLLSCIVTK